MTRETVMRVDKVRCWITDQVPRLHLEASGTVETGGWTDAELFHNWHGPAIIDGVYEFDFSADRPDGPAPDVISTISASYTAEDIPADFKAVKVIARENSLVAEPDPERCGTE